MIGKLLGIGIRTVSVGELEVGDRIRIDTFKNCGKTYHTDITISAILPSERLDDFYWVLGEGTSELLHVDKRIQLLRKGGK